MWKHIETAQELISDYATNGYRWFFTLSTEEWLLVLAVVSACGFLCMRGYGSRHNY